MMATILRNIFNWQITLLKLIIILSLVSVKINAQGLDITVTAGILGDIRGEAAFTNYNFKPYVKFNGIPFAKAEERFLPPEAIDSPLSEPGDVFHANSTRKDIKCTQPALEFVTSSPNLRHQENLHGLYDESTLDNGILAFDGVEDCLVLNVYTPKLPSNGGGNYSVIVFVYGGAFINGYGGFYEPDIFLENEEEVVLVTVNYRLGVLGFFSLETNEIPGNAALYDLVTALHWVQSYISYFGGNPDLVTLAGQSAGSAAVSYLMMSDLVTQAPKPLFHRAITASGSALNTWAINENPIPASLKIAKLANCSDTDVEGEADLNEIRDCMKSIDPDNLVVALTMYQNIERQAGRLGADAVSPVIQKSSWEPKFISRHPRVILEEGKQLNVPLLASAVKHEGSFPLGVAYNRYLNCPDCSDRLNDAEFLKKDLVPTLLRAMGIDDDTHEVYNVLAEKYLKESRFSGNFSEMVYGLLDLHSVFFFKAGIQRMVELHSRLNSNTYFYSFEYQGEYSIFPIYWIGFPIPNVPGGIAHGDDLIYLLFKPLFNFAEDQAISSKLVDHWINFANTGNPNPAAPSDTIWPSFNETAPFYLQLKSEINNIIGNDYPGTWSDASFDLKPIQPTEAPTTEAPSTEATTTEIETTTNHAIRTLNYPFISIQIIIITISVLFH